MKVQQWEFSDGSSAMGGQNLNFGLLHRQPSEVQPFCFQTQNHSNFELKLIISIAVNARALFTTLF